ncbi:MAG: hypothetical protein Q8R55_01530 [Candidatus Taylorbacteria bacterium]|nr:hypothetical protein [Candidatus Taylorbacteria bacterium]
MKLSLIALFLLLSAYLIIFRVELFCFFFDNKLGCYGSNLELRRGLFGIEKTKAKLIELYDKGRLSQGQCHSLSHEVGRAAARADKTIIESAMKDENSFCGWGYYHGVMEGLFGDRANHGTLAEDAVRICRNISGNFIDVFNCFHALGHGFYFADKDLIKAFEGCLNAGDNDVEDGYCVDGVFMANSFFAEPENKYFKKDDPIFPCDIVDDVHKPYCYWRSLPLNIFGQSEDLPDYDYISSIGNKVPEEFRLVFWNGIGRELDSRTASDMSKISELCGRTGGTYGFSCLIGAGRHMIFYDKGKTERAEELCSYLIPYEVASPRSSGLAPLARARLRTGLNDEAIKADCVNLMRVQSYPGIN